MTDDAAALNLPRRRRLDHALDRDGGSCVWCARRLRPGEASLEHVIPKLKGGPAWPENEVAACRPCNRKRGHQSPAVWLQACEEQGLRPDRAAIERSLVKLSAAIETRGGQRRARPYLAGQLRRLGLT